MKPRTHLCVVGQPQRAADARPVLLQAGNGLLEGGRIGCRTRPTVAGWGSRGWARLHGRRLWQGSGGAEGPVKGGGTAQLAAGG